MNERRSPLLQVGDAPTIAVAMIPLALLALLVRVCRILCDVLFWLADPARERLAADMRYRAERS